MKLGVKSGMVRSILGCQTGLNSFKMRFRVLTKHDNPRDILREKFVQSIRSNDFIEQLFPEARTKWLKDKGKHISESIDIALVEGIYTHVYDLDSRINVNDVRRQTLCTS